MDPKPLETVPPSASDRAVAGPPVSELATAVFHREVFPAEVAYFADRWRAAGSARDLPDGPRPVVTVHNGLVGLALSGGGIRSATFNLGVLQALHGRGILRHVDYLSTVSGGGFVGACLTALTRAPGSRFPFEHREREGEPAAVTYLRNHCNYLAPGGFVDYARMIGLLARGIFLNVVILAPLIAVVSVGVSASYRHRLLGVIERHPDASPWSWVDIHWLTPWAIGLGIVWALCFPAISYAYRVRFFKARRAGQKTASNNIRSRDLYERTFGGSFILVLVAGLIDFQPIFVHYFHRWYDKGGGVWTAVAGGASVAASVAASRGLAFFKEHGRIVGLVVAGVLGPLLPFIAYLYLTRALVYGDLEPFLGPAPSLVVLALAAVGFAFSYFLVDVNATSMHGFYRDRLSRAYLFRTGIEGRGEPRPEDDVSLQDICQEGSGAPYHLFNATLNLQGATQGLPRGRLSDYFVFSKHFIGSAHTGYCRTEHMVATFPFVHLASAMAVSGAAAAPNMGAFTSRALVFLMAALNIRMGYWLPNPRDIAAAVARSGAPASDVPSRRLWRPGPTLLLREMLSLLDAQGDAVNVSDGGHLENTGIYELLRRRCRYIVLGDAESDPEMAFHGLADVMRYARIDLGVEIELRLDDLAIAERKHCKQHCAFGRIRYPARGDAPPETGYLLYVKASLTGDEDGIVSEYRARSPEYPHESSADQFFDDRQFEAYRSLGYHAFDGLFEPGDAGETARTMTYPDVVDWFRAVELALAPRPEAGDQAGPLAARWGQIEELIHAPELAWYAREIYPELRDAGDGAPPPDAERLRRVLPVANMQLQLMERVFVALGLEDLRNRDHAGNRGWMNLLRRWAAAPSLRRAHAALVSSYSTGFQHFCKHALDLAIELAWSPAEADRAAPLDVAAFSTAPAERFVLRIREPGGAGFAVGEATVDRSGPGAPRIEIALRPGFDSADLRRAANHQLDRVLHGDVADDRMGAVR